MDLKVSLDVLIAGSDFASCQQRVLRFFERTMLVRFDKVNVAEQESMHAADRAFWPRLDKGVSANRKVVGELVASLQEEGIATFEDLRKLEQGYLTKILHTIAHLMDGFIGIDSRFYSLEEDSHSVSKALRKSIHENPGQHWLLRVIGTIASESQDPIDALRTFEMQKRNS